jgi:DNA-binding MarR family transcriptional regulator
MAICKEEWERLSDELSCLLLEFYNTFTAWEAEAVETLNKDLSILETHTIEALGRNPGMKMRELAETLGVTTPSVTAIVDKLESKGFAFRQTTPSDRRVFLVHLTEMGLDLYEKHSIQHRRIADRVLSCIPEKHMKLFVNMLRMVVEKTCHEKEFS